MNLGNDSGAGLYKGYVRTGTSGTPSMIEVTIKAADASSPNVSCNWQAQSVFGPVGATNINTAQVACNATTAGEIAYEVGGSRQITSICKCDSTVTPLSKAKTYYTNSTYSALRDSIFLGENVYAIVAGGNPADTWGCIDTPASNNCPSGVGWRKLTVPYNGGTPDEWQYNAANKRIELSAFYIYPSYPVGTYKGYTRNGANGEYTVTNFTVQSQLQWSCGAVFGPIQVPPISECSYEGKNVPVNGAPDGCTCVKK